MATMDKRLAVVTGGNRGIGYEICRQLAHKGLRVLLTSRDAEKGRAAHKKLEKEGLDVLHQRLDVADPASVAALAGFIESEYARVDVLVNNAGISMDKRSTSVLREKEEIFRMTLETNFYGALRMCQALVPLMQKNHYGRVLNLFSGLGQLDDMG